MKYKKITIETKTSAEDIISAILFDKGIKGILFDDNENLSKEDLEKMYVDIPLLKKGDDKAYASFFVYETDDKNIKKNTDTNAVDISYIDSPENVYTKKELDDLIKDIKDELEDIKKITDLGSLIFKTEEIENNDYLNKWKENFHSFNIDNIIIKPSFENYKEDDGEKIVINIDPGAAFGTGTHETTKLCIKAIKENLKKNDTLLDIGCGSGILGILALKLGAKKIINVDVDNNIKMTVDDNLEKNNIKENFELKFGNIINDDEFREEIKKEKYDIVVANILAPVIISLIKDAKIDEFTKTDGLFITSGIIDKKEKDVINAIKENKKLEYLKSTKDGEWVCIIAKKK